MQEAEKGKGGLESLQKVQIFWSVRGPAGTGRCKRLRRER